ncbi:hypothetical protein B9M81_11125 [Mycobacteroides abscessus]|nr:hypothetical protein CAK77_11320 [Mycobacteroides abscessus subsp. massiliense]OTQ94889.1 hypothetical protein B9M86_11130 [Mycobacteroides abscessus]ORA87265.1 hypothetical protein BST32_20555 [Mycobacteroides abscessus subsp. massiliense]OTQ99279.1 hypothetical protein B9M84_10975 [Mycobacteroides abscessus]OTR05660.1 hypothetical protein B9M83_12055 [Mycobacteroides abscessus]
MQLSLLGGLLTDNMAKCCADKAASAIQLASNARTEGLSSRWRSAVAELQQELETKQEWQTLKQKRGSTFLGDSCSATCYIKIERVTGLEPV